MNTYNKIVKNPMYHYSMFTYSFHLSNENYFCFINQLIVMLGLLSQSVIELLSRGIFVNVIRTTQHNNIFKSWWKSYISYTPQNIPYAIRVDAKIDKSVTKNIFPQIFVTYKTCRN